MTDTSWAARLSELQRTGDRRGAAACLARAAALLPDDDVRRGLFCLRMVELAPDDPHVALRAAGLVRVADPALAARLIIDVTMRHARDGDATAAQLAVGMDRSEGEHGVGLRVTVARTLLRRGEPGAALQVLRTVGTVPGRSRAHHDVTELLGQVENAVASDPGLLVTVAVAWRELGSLTDALLALYRATALDGARATELLGLAAHAIHVGEPAVALECLELCAGHFRGTALEGRAVGIASLLQDDVVHGRRARAARDALVTAETAEALRDAAHGLMPAARMVRCCRREWRAAVHAGVPLSLVLMQVDGLNGTSDDGVASWERAWVAQVAGRLQGAVRGAGGELGWYRGLTTMVLLPLNRHAALAWAGEAAREVARDEIAVGGLTIRATLCMCVSELAPCPGRWPSSLLREAEAALVSAVSRGGNRITLLAPDPLPLAA